ncbi:MAG: hypothetical protein OXG35_20995 [Acidobacteria bacterium]|nr:hypothetical protein [Acidobacteriota bacterium]
MTTRLHGMTLVRRTDAELRRRKSSWHGAIVRAVRPLSNRTGTVPRGTLMQVKLNRGGLDLKAPPCRCCGTALRIRGVPEADVEYLGHRRNTAGQPDPISLAGSRVDAWMTNAARQLRITVTGVDRSTDLDRLVQLQAIYPELQLEWGVLAGSHNGETPRFPELQTIRALAGRTNAGILKGAIHLCGRRARAVNAGDFDEALELCDGFSRIQVNSLEYDHEAVEQFAQRAGVPVIVQDRTNFEDTPPSANLSYLHDRSGGRGLSTMAAWGLPWPEVPCGYAGGIGPENIVQAVRKVLGAARSDAWLDMESAVRTCDDLDLQKVKAVCEAAARTVRSIRGAGR